MRRLARTRGLSFAFGDKACYRQVEGFRADRQEVGVYEAWRVHGKRPNLAEILGDKFQPETGAVVVRPDIYRLQSERSPEVFVS